MIEAFGGDFEYGSTADFAGSNTWTSIGQVLSYTPPQPSINAVTPPVALNAASRSAIPIPGSKNPGTATVTVAYSTGLHDTLAAFEGITKAWRGKLGKNATKAIAYNGWVSGVYPTEETADGWLQLVVNIQVVSDTDEVAVSA